MKRIFLLLSVLLPASLFFGEARAQILEEPQVQDNFYEKVNTKDKEPRPYVNVREADVYIKWRVWRTIDFRMKMNQYLYYPVEKTHDRISLMDLILEGMKDGIIVPYDPVSDQFNKPITYEEFQSQYTSRDTIEVESLDSAGLMEQRVVVEEFSPQNRGGKGVKCYKITEKTGNVVGIKAVDEDDEIMIINTEGIVIRMKCSSISILGRITSGVKLINLQENDKVASIAKVRKGDEEEEEESESSEKTDDTDN